MASYSREGIPDRLKNSWEQVGEKVGLPYSQTVAIIRCMNGVMEYGNSDGLPTVLSKPQRRLKVFIVEDELLNAELYRSLLAVLSNHFQTYEFADGDEAWAGLSKINPDILITDLLHPGLDGWELLDLLAKRKVTYPILIISGDYETEAHCRSCYPGLNIHLLGKPIHLQAFHEHMSSLLENFKATADDETSGQSALI